MRSERGLGEEKEMAGRYTYRRRPIPGTSRNGVMILFGC